MQVIMSRWQHNHHLILSFRGLNRANFVQIASKRMQSRPCSFRGLSLAGYLRVASTQNQNRLCQTNPPNKMIENENQSSISICFDRANSMCANIQVMIILNSCDRAHARLVTRVDCDCCRKCFWRLPVRFHGHSIELI